MMPLALEIAARAALVAAGTALVLRALRIRTAAVKHAAWTAVVVAMLALPIAQAGGVKLPLPLLRPAPAALVDVPAYRENAASGIAIAPQSDALAAIAMQARESAPFITWQGIFLGVYALGVIALLARLAIGTIQANFLRRNAVITHGRLTSARCATPITVGWFAPALILPPAWPRWPSAQLAAVLTHEAEHARRRDPLVQWVALFNRAIFWFHPLSWWLERRLATLAEEACDAAVIMAGHSPQEYTSYLLDLARSMTRQGRRLNIVGVAMPGSGLTARMHQILEATPVPRPSRVRLWLAVVLCTASSTIFAAATLSARTPEASWHSAAPAGQTPPKFDVVSIKPCQSAGGDSIQSPGSLHLDCQTLLQLIQASYIAYANGRINPPWTVLTSPVSGGPDWMKTDPYTIEAKASGTTAVAMMDGPMLQAVLEDRFKLKIHREAREVPVYELTVAKSGSKVPPFKEGSCVPRDWTKVPAPPLESGQRRCAAGWNMQGAKTVWDVEGLSLEQFAAMLRPGRPVIDKTGLTGLVSFHLEYDQSGAPDAVDAPVFQALKEQLGLELHPATGRRDTLVIDHVERPTPNESFGATAVAPTVQKFSVASIKPCESIPVVPGGRSGGSGHLDSSPGTLVVTCMTVTEMTWRAYVQYGNPAPSNVAGLPDADLIKGGPAWARTDRYSIETKAGGTPPLPTMAGSMLRALLEDRFQLKIRQDVKEVPAFALTVAPGGLKVKPADPESCTPPDPNNPGGPRTLGPDGLVRAVHGEKPLCVGGVGRHGANATYTVTGQSLDRVSRTLSSLIFTRPVIDQTGVKDLFSFAVEFAPDETMRPMPAHPDETAGAPDGPSLFAVLEKQLGLKLVPTKAQQGILVIDRLERPTPDGPVSVPSARAFGGGR